MKDSNTWQSLIDSVWGLQDDLFVVISKNSILQRHHCVSTNSRVMEEEVSRMGELLVEQLDRDRSAPHKH